MTTHDSTPRSHTAAHIYNMPSTTGMTQPNGKFFLSFIPIMLIYLFTSSFYNYDTPSTNDGMTNG